MNESAEAEPVNHPSIGGKEQEPQSGDVPNELFEATHNAFPALGRWTLRTALNSVPPGWMKTEQGWVQMEREGTLHSDTCPDPDVCEEGPMSKRCAGVGFYRVKQPPEDHPAG